VVGVRELDRMRWNLTDSEPFIELENVECSHCNESMVFEYAEIVPTPHKPPRDVRELAIHYKCLECGKRESFYPTISAETAEELRKRWRGNDFVPLNFEEQHKHQKPEDVFTEEELEKIEDRLKKLGYI